MTEDEIIVGLAGVALKRDIRGGGRFFSPVLGKTVQRGRGQAESAIHIHHGAVERLVEAGKLRWGPRKGGRPIFAVEAAEEWAADICCEICCGNL